MVPEYIKRLFAEVKPPPLTEPFSDTIKSLVARLDNVGSTSKKGN
jgi:hypothetical protein